MILAISFSVLEKLCELSRSRRSALLMGSPLSLLLRCFIICFLPLFQIISGILAFRKTFRYNWHFIPAPETFSLFCSHSVKHFFRTLYHPVFSALYAVFGKTSAPEPSPSPDRAKKFFALLPKNAKSICAICKTPFALFDTYFIRSAEIPIFQPPFGILFHKSRIRLTQNTFSFIIWILPVHRKFTNQTPDGRSQNQHEPESEEHVH